MEVDYSTNASKESAKMTTKTCATVAPGLSTFQAFIISSSCLPSSKISNYVEIKMISLTVANVTS